MAAKIPTNKFAKYLALFLLAVGALQIYSALTDPGPRYLNAIYCPYFAGGWHCQDSPQMLAVSPATWAQYALPFSISLLIIGAIMLFGTLVPSRKRLVPWAVVALVVWGTVEANYKPKVYEKRPEQNAAAVNAASAGPSPSPEAAEPQTIQTAVVTVWTRPNRSPAVAHTEMYPEGDILYLAYKNAVIFPGFDSALLMRTGKFSVVDAGGFPARYSAGAAYILYDVRSGWSSYSNLTNLQKLILQHFCQAAHLAVYEVIDPKQVNYLSGPDESNLASICGRPIQNSAEAQESALLPSPRLNSPTTLDVSAFDPDVPPGLNRPTDLVTLTYDPTGHQADPYILDLYVGRAQGGTRPFTIAQWLVYSQQNPRHIVLYDSLQARVMYYEELSMTEKSMVQGFCALGLQIYGRAPGVPEASFGTTLDDDFDQNELVSVCGTARGYTPPPFGERPRILWLAAIFCGSADGRCLTGHLLYDPSRARLNIEFRDASGADQMVSLADWLAGPQGQQQAVVIFNDRSVLPNGLNGFDGIVHPYNTMNPEQKSAVQDFCRHGLVIYSWQQDVADSSYLSKGFRLDPSQLEPVCADN